MPRRVLPALEHLSFLSSQPFPKLYVGSSFINKEAGVWRTGHWGGVESLKQHRDLNPDLFIPPYHAFPGELLQVLAPSQATPRTLARSTDAVRPGQIPSPFGSGSGLT